MHLRSSKNVLACINKKPLSVLITAAQFPCLEKPSSHDCTLFVRANDAIYLIVAFSK